MKATILNRDFKHPADGWYHIEPKGSHPNAAGKLVQVIDDDACTAIVNRFNQDADAGKLSHGSEMLIDHEHFKHDSGKETRAYGWLTRLMNREDGIYGQVRWTATGKEAVDGGDYRFFSTEYDPSDLKLLNDRRVRPLRLDGLTLTNDPNNRGARPITNRALPPVPDDGCCPDCNCQLVAGSADGQMACPECNETFADASASAVMGSATPGKKNNQVKNKMKNIANKLGLAAEASEEAILEAVTKIQNRLTTLEPLAEENTKLKNRLTELDKSSVDSLLSAHGVTEEKVLNRLKPILQGMEPKDRQGFLDECLPKTAATTTTASGGAQTKLFNRNTKTPGQVTSDEGNEKQQSANAQKIMNRAREIKKESPGVSDATAVIMAQREFAASA